MTFLPSFFFGSLTHEELEVAGDSCKNLEAYLIISGRKDYGHIIWNQNCRYPMFSTTYMV